MPDLDDVPDELDGELACADDALDDAPDILDDLAFDAAYEIPAGEMPTAEQTAAVFAVMGVGPIPTRRRRPQPRCGARTGAKWGRHRCGRPAPPLGDQWYRTICATASCWRGHFLGLCRSGSSSQIINQAQDFPEQVPRHRHLGQYCHPICHPTRWDQ